MNKKQLIIALAIGILISAITAVFFAKRLQRHSNPARMIQVSVGKEFIITLDSNKTTGFQWQLAAPFGRNIIQLVNSEYRVREPKLIGSGGKEIWIFKAIGAGKTNIFFKYARPWEKNIPPAKKETFVILVKG